jgi:hypothetical protein
MKDYFKYLLKLFLKALLPAFLIYFSKTDFISDILIENDFIVNKANISSFKFWAFLIGTVIAGIMLPIELYNTKKKLKKQNSIFKTVVPIITGKVAEDLGLKPGELSIRVFKVEKSILSQTIKLVHLYLEEITNKLNGKNDLVFEVSKDTIQGVIGKTYSEESYIVDYNISNLENSYDLTSEQKNRVGDVKFCCAAPIFKYNKIKYVISLDSEEKIYKSKVKTAGLKKNLVYLCQLFDEFIL